MSLVVNQRPSTTISGETSKWNAARNPIVYKMQRKDFVFNQINDNGGFVQVQINGVNVTGSFANGDSLYVGSDNGVYADFGLQTAEAFSGGNTLITTDIPYVSAAPGGFVNNDTLKPLYKVEIEVYNGDDEILGDTYTYSPDSTGYLFADISSVFLSVLNPDITLPSEIGEDTNFTEFYIKYREVWYGSGESQTDDSSNNFFAVLGARQIPATYGGNLADYVTFDDASPKGQFITLFETPKMWRGFPFYISAIIGDSMANTVYFDVKYYNKDGDLISSDNTSLADYAGKIMIISIPGILAIPDLAVYCEIRAVRNGTGDDIIDPFRIDILDPCDNPVMILGRNSLGGIIQWVFEYSQDEHYDFGNSIKNKRLQLAANGLTANEWDALHDFMTLGEVYRDNILELTSSVIKTNTRIGNQVYDVAEDGSKVGVIVIPTRNKTRTRLQQHYFEIEIEYPQIF